PGTWTMVQDYSATNTYTWTATMPAGGYYLGVHVRRGTSTAPFEATSSIPYTLTPTTCAAANVSAAPPSPSVAGAMVTLTAASTGCPNPRYEFWARWQGSSTWQLLKAYSAGNTYAWNSSGALAGTEYFGVWVRDASSPAAYDAINSLPYSVTAPTCSAVTLSAAPPGVVHGSGSHVTLTAAASGCPNPNPLYQFWMRPASSSTWTLVRGYSTAATYDWNSTGALAGTVYFGVWAKDAASPNSYDAVANTTVTVT